MSTSATSATSAPQLRSGSAHLRAESPAPRLGSLFAVPAWRVIGGRDHGEGTHAFHDPDTLEPVAVPRLWADRALGIRFVQAIGASASGTR